PPRASTPARRFSDLARLLVAGRQPRGEEVVLQHRHPAVAGLQVEPAVLEVILVELAAVVAAVVPGGAIEAEGLGAGVAALDHRRLRSEEHTSELQSRENL